MSTITTYNDRESRLMETNIRTFLEIKAAYDECDREVQEVIDQMLAIYNDGSTTEDQRRRALHTILEALFPALAEDILDSVKLLRERPDSLEYEEEMDSQEATFAERLKAAMENKGLTQEVLASKIGVRQSAVSNMLSRQSRPQMKTVERIAEALEMPPDALWPDYAEASH